MTNKHISGPKNAYSNEIERPHNNNDDDDDAATHHDGDGDGDVDVCIMMFPVLLSRS